MRRRPAADAHATEVARRRLEALSRELGLDGSRDDPEGPPTAEQDPREARVGVAVGAAHGASPPVRRRSASWVIEEAVPRGAAEGPGEPVHRGPGRHALPRLPWRERLGLWLTERSGSGGQFGAAHLAVVALLVAASLALGAWHTMRGSVERAPVAAPTLAAPSTDGGGADDVGGGAATRPAESVETGAAEAGASPTSGSEVVVDVVGRVRRPGIAVLPAGSRVVDALEAAGGTRPGVRTDSLNLARPLADGEQIVVGRATAVSAPPATSGTTGGSLPGSLPGAPAAPVNLNTADQVALETLPGVGPVTAAAILQWRTEHGGFTAVEELLEVSGIGDATLAEIAPHVTI